MIGWAMGSVEDGMGDGIDERVGDGMDEWMGDRKGTGPWGWMGNEGDGMKWQWELLVSVDWKPGGKERDC